MTVQPKIPGLARIPRLREQEPEGEGSVLENRLLAQLRGMGVPEPVREWAFRRWRCDFAWPALGLVVEVEGGVWHAGRHVRPLGFIRDTRKYNALALAGMTVLRYAEVDVRSGRAALEIHAALDGRMQGR